MLIDPNQPTTPLERGRFLPVTAVPPAKAVQARVPQEENADGAQARGDSLEIAPETLAHLSHEPGSAGAASCPLCQAEAKAGESPAGEEGQSLAPEEQQQLAELQSRDREVRSHEEAHKSAAGNLAAGGPSYETETGPDGREYAVGGEVPIQLRSGSTPEETIRLAQQARRAALAPAQPSAQDQAVAAEAAQREAQARAEAYQQTSEPETSSILGTVFG